MNVPPQSSGLNVVQLITLNTEVQYVPPDTLVTTYKTVWSHRPDDQFSVVLVTMQSRLTFLWAMDDRYYEADLICIKGVLFDAEVSQ
jgi:hypothetical protein